MLKISRLSNPLELRLVSFAEPAPRTLRQDLNAGVVDGTCHSIMVGIGETYLAAFTLALGLGEVAAGLITTLPLLAGALLQMAAPWGVKQLGSPRRWVVLCASLQALCFVPLMLMAISDRLPAWFVFPLAAAYWAAGLSTSAAWNTWMGSLIPAAMRAKVFASRTRLAQLGLLGGFVLGGVALQYAAQHSYALRMFALLFLIAGVCRFISVVSLWYQSDVAPHVSTQREVPITEWIGRLRSSPDGQLLAYLLAVQCSVHISGAYFTPYMLKHLGFSYAQYMVIIAAAVAGKALAVPMLGRVAHKWGARKLLFYGGVGIIPLSSLWLVSSAFPFLVAIQLVGAVAWAAYELAMALLFLEAIRDDERTSVLTTFNFAWSLATVVGSLIGASVLLWGDKSPAAYLSIFGLSCVARVAALALLKRVPEFNRTLEQLPSPQLVEAALAVEQEVVPAEQMPSVAGESIAA